MTDRGAAREVLASAVPTTLVPIQTCAEVAMTSQLLLRRPALVQHSWCCFLQLRLARVEALSVCSAS